MPDKVRVKQKATGHELTVDEEWADQFPDDYEVLDKDAVDAAGDPLPPKYKTTVSTEAAKKAASSAPKKTAASSAGGGVN